MDYASVERVEGIETANGLRASEVHRDDDSNSPGPHGGGDARDFGYEVRCENVRVGVDIVDGARVDSQ